MFRFYKVTLIIISLIVLFSCKTKQNNQATEVKIYRKITDSLQYFNEYDDKYITSFKYFNKKLVVYNKFNEKLQIYNESNHLLVEFSNKGKGPGELLNPTDLYFDNDGIFVLDSGNRKVAWFNLEGEIIKEIPIQQTGLSFTKIDSDIFISVLGTFDFYIYKYNIKGESNPVGFFNKKNNFKTFDPGKIFADSYNIGSNDQYVYLTKLYEDSLLIFSNRGNLFSKSSRGLRNIVDPKSTKENSRKINMQIPMNLDIARDDKNNVYLLSQNPKKDLVCIYKYSSSGSNTAIYEVPFKTSMIEVLDKGKFLLINENYELVVLKYNTSSNY